MQLSEQTRHFIAIVCIFLIIFSVGNLRNPERKPIAPGTHISTVQKLNVNTVAISSSGLEVWSTTGKSMLPAIGENGTIVIKRNYRADEINIGDIIVFKNGAGKNIEHRVVSVVPPYLITKGDNNQYPDSEKVHFDNVTGIVVAILY